jgi:hypothetical protein
MIRKKSPAIQSTIEGCDIERYKVGFHRYSDKQNYMDRQNGAMIGQSVVLQRTEQAKRQAMMTVLQSGMPEQTTRGSKSTLEASYSVQAIDLAGVQ